MEVSGERKNEAEVKWHVDRSPKGVYESHNRSMSQEFTAAVPGMEEGSPALARPFEVELVRLAPGMKNCPRHAHSVQWEYYIVISGNGRMLQAKGASPLPMQPGDHLIQPPGSVHTVENDSEEALCYYVIADNPSDETCAYPDSGKWLAAGHIFRMVDADYFDGEE
ncbi:MAG: cupin domain-containing protein [Sulfobacillus sp.]